MIRGLRKTETDDRMTLVQHLRTMHSLLSIKEAAVYLREHHITTYKRAKAGQMPSTRYGGRVKIDSVELAAWLEQRSVSA